MDSLTFVIPAYNDQATIETVIRKTVRAGSDLRIPFTILVIDDASTDSTHSILSGLTKHIHTLTVITHTQNAGYGKTIKELYQKARSSWLFSLPGDYQIEPSEVIKLWPHRSEADMIIAWRRDRCDTIVRVNQSHIYNMILRGLFNVPVHDVNSVRLMKTSIIKSFPLISTSAFIDAEMVIQSKRAGFHIIELPISHRARTGLGASGGRITTIIPTIRDLITFATAHASGYSFFHN